MPARAGAGTFFERTMSTCAPASFTAAASPSEGVSAFSMTVHPSALMPSMPDFSNLSAIRMFMVAPSAETV
jgi:hypothetical protein